VAMILVVEDETLLGKTLAASLSDDGHRTHWVSSAEHALEWLADRQADLALVDCRLPGMNGLDLLGVLATSSPDTAVVMMTAYADVPTAVRAMKDGASDFLIKPVDLDVVSLVARKNLKHRRMSQRLRHEQKSRSQAFGLHRVIGRCADIEKAKTLVRRLTDLQVPSGESPPNVLITGETGTGKDVFAQAIHYEGPRRAGLFVHVNAAALPEKLVESELFGHVKGAFTGAGVSKRGLFEVADGGTLFLDEIGALDLSLQAKVLTVIETGCIRPVGAAEETTVNVHLVAAMNQDPVAWMKDGKFREDLYHRLRVIHLALPPLRHRGKDIDLLADSFLDVYCRKFQLPRKTFSRAAREVMRRYDWPGNVRELSHCIESAVLLAGDTIGPEDLPSRRKEQLGGEVGDKSSCIPIDFSAGPIPLERVEGELIRLAMTETDQNISRAAQLLDISRDALRYRLDKFGANGRLKGSQATGGTS
jgi:two-component system, NtrC family, response regulator AtoC